MDEKHAPLPSSYTFGDGIHWTTPTSITFLYVELPFWLMSPPGQVKVDWSGTSFSVEICPDWMEVFIGQVVDSRASVIHHGPRQRSPLQLPLQLASEVEKAKAPWLSRPCKTVLRLQARAHDDAFRPLTDSDLPRAAAEQRAYWASLCEAHIPVINELIQRYRLLTYDFAPFEVSPWDVPVWYLKHADIGHHTVLMPYAEWDNRPMLVSRSPASGAEPVVVPVVYATPANLSTASSADASAGELDLLDARSLMERGDYTGAVRRTVTAIEALLRAALARELAKKKSPIDAEKQVAKTDNDFPGRLRQWRKLAKPQVSDQEFEEFERTRKIRHEIVHRAHRLTHVDRDRAQRAVDTGGWLYNKIEARPDRAAVRDHGVLRSCEGIA